MNNQNAPGAESVTRLGGDIRASLPAQTGRGQSMTPLAAAIVAVLYPAAMTLAQGASPAAGQLEEIVVTATRRDVNLQNVAQSVTAFSTADIERQAMQSTADVINALPSVNLVAALPGRNAIVMRGVSTGSSEYRTDSQVSVYLDDQPMTSISTQVDVRLIDLARIEALPGPQGTLFGSSSQSGTIRYITNKPNPNQFTSQVDAEFGTTKGGEESYDLSGHLNVPVTDSIAVRAAAYYSVEGGYVDNVLGPTLMGDQDNASVVEQDWNDYKTWGGRIAARWQVNPEWESTLSLISQYSEADGAWESDPALGDYKITRFFEEYRDDDWYQASLNVKGDLGFAELSVTASYFDRSIKYEWDNANYSQWRSAYYGGFDPTDPDSGSYNVYNTGTLIGTTFNDQKQKRSAYEVRLTSQGESRFAWMAGAFYEDVEDSWHYGAKLPGLTGTTAWEAANYYACYANELGYDVACPLAPTDIYYSDKYRKTIKQTALFGEVTYSLTDRWSITGGARWFEYDRDQKDVYNIPLGLPINNDFEGGGINASQGKESDTVFKLATEYHIDDDRMVYLLYSEGFRLGGSNSERAAATGILPLTYQPDKLSNYEAGLKSQWLDHAVTLNVALFFMQWDHIQLNASGSAANNPFWLRGTFNGGKAEQKGIEMNGAWQVTPNFKFEASAFFADPEFSEETIYPDGGLAIPAGTVMPISPERKYWAAVEYMVPNFMNLDGNLWTRLSYSYQSEVWKSTGAIADWVDATTPEERAAARELLLPSYSTGTLQFGYTATSGWETSLVVRNLFDETGYNYISSSNYGDSPEIGWNDSRWKYVRSLQRPRTISLSFTKKW
ncbi:MAG: TonB-dependent receptor [Steroidobacteraceae bacterium]|jgi:outer membrane receptor protein involved in Fe transport|nr:TonB-dependent receptor [Steroidobacteraceae bacterium]